VLLSAATRVTSGYRHVFDSQCGYTAIRRAALERIALDELFPRYGLREVTGRRGDDSVLARLVEVAEHAVQGGANLERSGGLQRLEFQINGPAAGIENVRTDERGGLEVLSQAPGGLVNLFDHVEIRRTLAIRWLSENRNQERTRRNR
jgi:hypothetical protein